VRKGGEDEEAVQKGHRIVRENDQVEGSKRDRPTYRRHHKLRVRLHHMLPHFIQHRHEPYAQLVCCVSAQPQSTTRSVSDNTTLRRRQKQGRQMMDGWRGNIARKTTHTSRFARSPLPSYPCSCP
jgi:hypothetical protein